MIYDRMNVKRLTTRKHSNCKAFQRNCESACRQTITFSVKTSAPKNGIPHAQTIWTSNYRRNIKFKFLEQIKSVISLKIKQKTRPKLTKKVMSIPW